MQSFRETHADFVWQRHSMFRELRDLIQGISKTEVTPELLAQVEKRSDTIFNNFKEDWTLMKSGYIRLSHADHASRGLGNSSLVTSVKAITERDYARALQDMESEHALVKAVLESKRRLLDPTLA